MAETLVEKDACVECGTVVREGSAFCYNCGEALKTEQAPPPIVKPPTGTLNGRDQKNDKNLELLDPEPPPVALPQLPLDLPRPSDPGEPEHKPLSKVQFPAARREIRKGPKKTIEIEWVERRPTVVRFIVAAILTALMVAGLILAAAYLR